MDRLFVYGSLKCGEQAHHLLAGAWREADGVLPGFKLIEHKGFPSLQRGQHLISGEVYRIRTEQWSVLDAWEEVPTVYCRSQVPLQDGRIVWVYEAPKPTYRASSRN